MAGFQSLPGFRDFYPEDFSRRQHIFRVWRQSAAAYGFQEYDAPVLEPLELYKAKSGDEIEAQLFSFLDKGEREVALRPEMTPTVCRMVGARAGALKRPIKWFSIAEFYRYERAQKGRLRGFHQLNADIFGEPGPEAEVELIALLIQCLAGFGLTKDDFCIRLSDRDLWFYALRASGLAADATGELLSAADKLEKQGEKAFEPFLQKYPAGRAAVEISKQLMRVKSLDGMRIVIESFLATNVERAGLEARYQDWVKLLDGLAAMELKDFIQVDLSVVRGLAYYTGFVFEAFDRKGDLRALAGGGRYNDLIKKLGGPDLPAVGFAIGDVTTGLLLEQRDRMPRYFAVPDVYVVLAGERARVTAYPQINALRAAGFRVEYPFKDLAFGKQFKAAAESGAKLALIYGDDELAKGVVKIRDMSGRTEREVPRREVLTAVRDILADGSGGADGP